MQSNNNLMKCECGNIFQGNFCPVCGRRAVSVEQTRTTTQKPNLIKCECGNEFQGDFCPICGRRAVQVEQVQRPIPQQSVQRPAQQPTAQGYAQQTTQQPIPQPIPQPVQRPAQQSTAQGYAQQTPQQPIMQQPVQRAAQQPTVQNNIQNEKSKKGFLDSLERLCEKRSNFRDKILWIILIFLAVIFLALGNIVPALFEALAGIVISPLIVKKFPEKTLLLDVLAVIFSIIAYCTL